MASAKRQNQEPSTGEKRFAQTVLLNGEPPLWMTWMTKRKKDKIQDRLLIVGRYRVFSVKRTVSGKKKVQRVGHYFDLVEIESRDIDRVVLKFRTFEIDVQSTNCGVSLLAAIRGALQRIAYGYPEYAMPRIVLMPPERTLATLPDIDPGPANGFVACYLAYCDYYKSPPSQVVIKSVTDQAAKGSTELILDQMPGIERKEQPISVAPIRAALRHNTYFTSVMMRHVHRKDVCGELADAITHNVTLQQLILSDTDADANAFAAMGAAIKLNQYHSITDIDFSCNHMRDKGVIAIAEGLGLMKHTMQRINLACCNLSPKGTGSLITQLQLGREVALGLLELDLSHNGISQTGSMQLSQWLMQRGSGSLCRLYLSNTKVDVATLARGIKGGTVCGIQDLDISWNKIDSAAALALGVLFESINTLKNLNVSHCSMGNTQLTPIIQAIARGESTGVCVNISNNDLAPAGAATIGQALATSANFNTILARACSFKKDGLSKLIDGLGNNTTLQILDISLNFHEGTPAKMLKVVSSLSDVVKKHPSLLYLGVGGDGNKASIGKEILPLLKVLGENPPLVELDITGNKIGDELAEQLADQLRKNTVLCSLRWDKNNLTTAGWQSLLNSLSYNHSLCHCPMPNYDVEKAIKESRNKDVSKEKITDQMRNINDALKRNANGQPYTSIIADKQGRIYFWSGSATRPFATGEGYTNLLAPPGSLPIPAATYSADTTSSSTYTTDASYYAGSYSQTTAESESGRYGGSASPRYGAGSEPVRYPTYSSGGANYAADSSYDYYQDDASQPPEPVEDDSQQQIVEEEDPWVPQPPPSPPTYENDYNQEYDDSQFEDAPPPPPVF